MNRGARNNNSRGAAATNEDEDFELANETLQSLLRGNHGGPTWNKLKSDTPVSSSAKPHQRTNGTAYTSPTSTFNNTLADILRSTGNIPPSPFMNVFKSTSTGIKYDIPPAKVASNRFGSGNYRDHSYNYDFENDDDEESLEFDYGEGDDTGNNFGMDEDDDDDDELDGFAHLSVADGEKQRMNIRRIERMGDIMGGRNLASRNTTTKSPLSTVTTLPLAPPQMLSQPAMPTSPPTILSKPQSIPMFSKGIGEYNDDETLAARESKAEKATTLNKIEIAARERVILTPKKLEFNQKSTLSKQEIAALAHYRMLENSIPTSQAALPAKSYSACRKRGTNALEHPLEPYQRSSRFTFSATPSPMCGDFAQVNPALLIPRGKEIALTKPSGKSIKASVTLSTEAALQKDEADEIVGDSSMAVDRPIPDPQTTKIPTVSSVKEPNVEDSEMTTESSSISMAEEFRLMKLEMEKMEKEKNDTASRILELECMVASSMKMNEEFGELLALATKGASKAGTSEESQIPSER